MIVAAPHVVNRIAPHLVPAAPIRVPETLDGKQAAWSEALFAAVLFYRARLEHPDPDAAERAAAMIFELEKTRLRHGREIAGTQFESSAPGTGDDRPPPVEDGPGPNEDRPEREPANPIAEPDADDDVEAVYHPEDLAAAERFVRSPEFREEVAAAREFLRARGRPHDEARAGELAMRRFLARRKRKRIQKGDDSKRGRSSFPWK